VNNKRRFDFDRAGNNLRMEYPLPATWSAAENGAGSTRALPLGQTVAENCNWIGNNSAADK
jgi:hypothetical protein